MRVLQTLALPLGHDASFVYYKMRIANRQSSSERAMGFEPTTFSLARRRSTTEPRPQFGLILTGSAETQNRTVDTAIFSRVLYQLSYLGQMFRC
jgi:hypothetical protein